jgi:hypothetical protein
VLCYDHAQVELVAKKHRKSRRLLSKILFLLTYAAVIAVIAAIFFMKDELRRIGFFGTESAAVHAPVQPSSPSPLSGTTTREESKSPTPPPAGTAMREEAKPSPRSAEELTRDDKKQLDDILRARGKKQ